MANSLTVSGRMSSTIVRDEHFTIHGLPPRSPESVLARCATQQHKYWPILLVWAQQPILSRNPPDEVGKRHATRLANQPTSLELLSAPLAIARGGEMPGRANHVTHPSPLGVPSHQADVQIVEVTASRSCTLPRVHMVLDITCIEHPSTSAGQEVSGHCLGTTSSHDHTSVCSIKHLFTSRVPHSPYSTCPPDENVWTLSVVGRRLSTVHLYV
jgi:hypothetical protein